MRPLLTFSDPNTSNQVKTVTGPKVLVGRLQRLPDSSYVLAALGNCTRIKKVGRKQKTKQESVTLAEKPNHFYDRITDRKEMVSFLVNSLS